MQGVLFGATGMVGIEVLHRCLDEDRIEKVVAIGRRTTGVHHPKLTEVNHADYTDYTTVEPHLSKADLCFYCIGVYQGMLPEAEFLRITCDYLEALVDTFERVRPDVTFCLFSAQGADPKEESRVLFARAKGHAENALFNSKLTSRYAFRPGFINPGRRQAKSRIPVWFARPFYKAFPVLGIDAVDLARVMVDVGLDGYHKHVLENGDMRALARDMPRTNS